MITQHQSSVARFFSEATEDFRYCVFRRPEGLEDAFLGNGDIDILIPEADHAAFVARIRGLGGRRGRLDPHHDNAVPGREDWFLLDRSVNAIVHFDVHTKLNAGPRFAKIHPILDYSDVDNMAVEQTSRGPINVAAPEFAVRVSLVKAAFTMRAFIPVGRKNIPLPKRQGNCPAGEIIVNLKGLATQMTGQGNVASVRVADLWSLRRAIIGRVDLNTRITTFVTHLCNMALYGGARLLQRSGAKLRPKRSPFGGGLVVALVGPDGMGKSTQVSVLQERFSRKFATTTCYLGSSGKLSRLVLALRARRSDFAPSGGGGEGGQVGQPRQSLAQILENLARVVWGLILARQRRRTLVKARRLANRGYIVICDRWPQSQKRGYLDGPVRRKTSRSPAFMERLFEKEENIYRAFDRMRPDVLFHLLAPYSVANTRKPGELSELNFDKRQALMVALKKHDDKIQDIDASANQEDVTGCLMQMIWQRF